MTELSNKEVLEQVIQKAKTRGYKFRYHMVDIPSMNYEEVYGVIFDHDFCKALWGEEPWIAYQYHKTLERKDEDLIESGGRLLWQYHMQEIPTERNATRRI